MLRFFVQAVLSAAILAGGFLGARQIVRTRPAVSELLAPGPRPVIIETAVLERRDLPWVIRAVGTLVAGREAVLSSEVGGRIVFVRPDLAPGATLDEGAVVIELDGASLALEATAGRTAQAAQRVALTSATADVERLEAALALAEESETLEANEEARWQTLVAQGRADQVRLDASRRALLAARSRTEAVRRSLQAARALTESQDTELQLAGDRLALIEDRLKKLVIRAPFEGRYVRDGSRGTRALEVGEVVAPFAPLGRLVDATSLRLIVDVHVDDARLVRPGTSSAAAAIDARPGLLLEGSVRSVGAVIDPLTRSVPVEVEFKAQAERPFDVPSGAFARAQLFGGAIENALVVDERWIAYRDGHAVLFTVSEAPQHAGPTEGPNSQTDAGTDSIPKWRVTETRIELRAGSSEGWRCLTSGPPVGSLIVTSPLELVGEGMLVERAK